MDTGEKRFGQEGRGPRHPDIIPFPIVDDPKTNEAIR